MHFIDRCQAHVWISYSSWMTLNVSNWPGVGHCQTWDENPRRMVLYWNSRVQLLVYGQMDSKPIQTNTVKTISLRNVLSSGFPWLALWGKPLSFLRQESLSSPGIFIALKGVSTIAFLTLLHNYHWHYYFHRHLSFPLKCKIFEGRKIRRFCLLI